MTTAMITSRAMSASIRVRLTGGNIRNGHVYLRDHLSFFPKSAIRGKLTNGSSVDPCVLILPSGSVVETEIDADKAMFRWRGWRKVFREQGAAEGDSVVFTRQAKGRYSVAIQHAVLDGMAAPGASDESPTRAERPRRKVRRCNDLSGDEWLRCSISIWSDVRKTAEEAALNHPAMFPSMLCERLMSMFLRRRGKHRVLDPFMGSGSTLVAARNLGKVGVGFEISGEYVQLAKRRLSDRGLFNEGGPSFDIHETDARNLGQHLKPSSVDLCITSPPYWDILNQRRTADYKSVRHYGNLDADLGVIADYNEFLTQLQTIFRGVLDTLRPGAYCAVVVMDLRKKHRLFALHSDLARRLVDIGFLYDDVIIWDRGHEYNNLRPLGYPAVFRINKIHEYILILQRPQSPA